MWALRLHFDLIADKHVDAFYTSNTVCWGKLRRELLQPNSCFLKVPFSSAQTIICKHHGNVHFEAICADQEKNKCKRSCGIIHSSTRPVSTGVEKAFYKGQGISVQGK